MLERDRILDELKIHLHRVQQQMKLAADNHRRDMEYKAGDWVYVKMRPYRQRSPVVRYNEKLAPRYYGPFEVLASVGKMAYRLSLPAATRVHLVFHVLQLRKAVGNAPVTSSLPLQLGEDWELLVEPEFVLRFRQPNQGTTEAMEILIQWKGLSPMEATWEPFDLINQQFPSWHLADKVTALGVRGRYLINPQLNLHTQDVKKGQAITWEGSNTRHQGTVIVARMMPSH